jgi:hypothetical protein
VAPLVSELLRRDCLLEGADSVELCLEIGFLGPLSPPVLFLKRNRYTAIY